MRNLNLLVLLVLVLFAMRNNVHAQQDAQYTHYMYNTQAVNPAYSGSREALTVTALHRSQWAGFEGAPVTQSLTMHTPFMNEKLGLGLSVVQDKVGPASFGTYFADLSYKIKFENNRTLAFGLKGGIRTVRADFTSLEAVTAGDNALQSNLQGEVLPNVGTGLYYYTQKFYAGISVPKIMQNTFTPVTGSGFQGVDGEQRHYYFISGAYLPLNKSLALKPFGFVRVTNGAPIEMDLTTTLIINDRISTGLMVRTGDAYGILLGVYLTEQLELGYSYDWSYQFASYSGPGGSHEVVLRYDFVFSRKKSVRSPRNFYF